MADRRRRRRVSSNSESELSETEETSEPKTEAVKVRESECESEGFSGKEQSQKDTTSELETEDNEEDEDEYTYTEDDDYTEYTEDNESVLVESEYAESLLDEERQSGDGQEQPDPNEVLDDDEDKKNPAYIPRKGAFYEHDTRLSEEDAAELEKEKKEEEPEKNTNKLWQDTGKSKWDHDRYNDDQQKPKSRDEIIALYGYDIRIGEKPPNAPNFSSRARRGRRSDNMQLRDYIKGDAGADGDNQQGGRRGGYSNENRRGGWGGDSKRGGYGYGDNRSPESNTESRRGGYSGDNRRGNYGGGSENRRGGYRDNQRGTGRYGDDGYRGRGRGRATRVEREPAAYTNNPDPAVGSNSGHEGPPRYNQQNYPAGLQNQPARKTYTELKNSSRDSADSANSYPAYKPRNNNAGPTPPVLGPLPNNKQWTQSNNHRTDDNGDVRKSNYSDNKSDSSVKYEPRNTGIRDNKATYNQPYYAKNDISYNSDAQPKTTGSAAPSTGADRKSYMRDRRSNRPIPRARQPDSSDSIVTGNVDASKVNVPVTSPVGAPPATKSSVPIIKGTEAANYPILIPVAVTAPMSSSNPNSHYLGRSQKSLVMAAATSTMVSTMNQPPVLPSSRPMPPQRMPLPQSQKIMQPPPPQQRMQQPQQKRQQLLQQQQQQQQQQLQQPPPGQKAVFPAPPKLDPQGRPKRYSTQRREGNYPEPCITEASISPMATMAPTQNVVPPPMQALYFPRPPVFHPNTEPSVVPIRPPVSNFQQPPPPMIQQPPPMVSMAYTIPVSTQLQNTPRLFTPPVLTSGSAPIGSAPAIVQNNFVPPPAQIINYGPPGSTPQHFQLPSTAIPPGPIPIPTTATVPQLQYQNTPPPQAQGEPGIHVRGGTTYFHPELQQPGHNRAAVYSRPKAAIPIINPQDLEQPGIQLLGVEDMEELQDDEYGSGTATPTNDMTPYMDGQQLGYYVQGQLVALAPVDAQEYIYEREQTPEADVEVNVEAGQVLEAPAHEERETSPVVLAAENPSNSVPHIEQEGVHAPVDELIIEEEQMQSSQDQSPIIQQEQVAENAPHEEDLCADEENDYTESHDARISPSQEVQHSDDTSRDARISPSQKVQHLTETPSDDRISPSQEVQHSTKTPSDDRISPSQEVQHSDDTPSEARLSPSQEVQHSDNTPRDARISPSQEVQHLTETPSDYRISPSQEVQHSTQTPSDDRILPSQEVQHLTETPSDDRISPSQEVQHSTETLSDDRISPSQEVQHSTETPSDDRISPSQEVQHSTETLSDDRISPSQEVQHSAENPSDARISPSQEVQHSDETPMLCDGGVEPGSDLQGDEHNEESFETCSERSENASPVLSEQVTVAQEITSTVMAEQTDEEQNVSSDQCLVESDKTECHAVVSPDESCPLAEESVHAGSENAPSPLIEGSKDELEESKAETDAITVDTTVAAVVTSGVDSSS